LRYNLISEITNLNISVKFLFSVKYLTNNFFLFLNHSFYIINKIEFYEINKKYYNVKK